MSYAGVDGDCEFAALVCPGHLWFGIVTHRGELLGGHPRCVAVTRNACAEGLPTTVTGNP